MSRSVQGVVDRVVRETPGVSWSISVHPGDGGAVAEHEPLAVLPTASVGKVLLLLEAARRIEDQPDTATVLLDRHAVAGIGEAGLWQHLDVAALSVADTAVLIGSFSDNLATNLLIDHLGLGSVHALTRTLGLTRTSLLDRVRDVRGPQDPPHLSAGCARELAGLMGGLAAGTVVSPAVAERVRGWLSTNADLSMVAFAFDLDPLAHSRPDRGISLFHKTGTDPGNRADVGHVGYGGAGLAYAVIASWPLDRPDARRDVLTGMRQVGNALRERLLVEGGPRSTR